MMETENNSLAQRLKKAREIKGWSQPHLALVADVSTSTVGMIESGARQNKGSLPALAEALGVRYKWLISGEGEMLESTPIPDSYQPLLQDEPPADVRSVPKGTTRVQKWHPDATEAERLHQALETLISIIPADRKVAVLEEVLRVVGARLRPSATSEQEPPAL